MGAHSSTPWLFSALWFFVMSTFSFTLLMFLTFIFFLWYSVFLLRKLLFLLAIPVGDAIWFWPRSFFSPFFSFFFFPRHDFVRAISLEPSLVETPNWVCCLVLRSNFALLLTMQFASLISSLINIISLDVTSFNSAVTLKLKCGA